MGSEVAPKGLLNICQIKTECIWLVDWIVYRRITPLAPKTFSLANDIHKFAVIRVLCSTRHAILCAPCSWWSSLVTFLAFSMACPLPLSPPRQLSHSHNEWELNAALPGIFSILAINMPALVSRSLRNGSIGLNVARCPMPSAVCLLFRHWSLIPKK